VVWECGATDVGIASTQTPLVACANFRQQCTRAADIALCDDDVRETRAKMTAPVTTNAGIETQRTLE
jgi:hypothetical protein